ncbi:MAG: hypothetical protein CBC13_03995 [Planctomycetia bacterium TMED53]|nr:MAG: hypothetical protein CBC13_03995 [Planctomycetia bacterium TMED53]
MKKEILYRVLGVSMIQKDLFLAMKRTSWMIIQLLYLLVMGFVLAVAIVAWDSDISNGSSLWSTADTATVVSTYLFCQVLVICVIFPFLAGSSISRERSEKTWSLLKTTAMTPGELIRGKYFALVSQCLYVMLLTAPLLVMTTLLGGVSLGAVIWEYLLHICLVAWICAVGVLSSALARKGVGAILGTPLFFFFPMMFVIALAGETYLGNQSMLLGQIEQFFTLDALAGFISVSAFVLSGVAALVGAIHLISPVNSLRSLPTRFGIFALYFYASAAFLYYVNSNIPSWFDYYWVVAMFVGGAGLPLLRIAGGEPQVPLSVRQFGRDHPFPARMLAMFLPGGLRNLLFCFLILCLFIPLGLVEIEPSTARSANLDVSRVEADVAFSQGLYFSVLFWVAAVLSFAWFLGQCGCSSILSASVAFTVHLIALLAMTVLSVRFDYFWPVFSPNFAMISTPFNLFQILGSSSARSFQRGFEAYFESSIRMDTLFNLLQIGVFTGLGCFVSLRNKKPLLSLESESDAGLLLDLPAEIADVSPVTDLKNQKPDLQEETK